MRAINLIPAEERRGSGPAGGGSGSGAYLVLGALGVLLVAVVAYVLTTNSINQAKGDLVRLTEDANRVEAQAQALKPYRDFATLRQKRLETVSALATSRFDWERTMRQLARVLPADVSLTSFTGTVAPGVALQGGGSGGGQSLRAAINAPAIELVGCARSQSEVSRVMSRLRRITGVTRVALSSSEKNEQQIAGTATPGSSGASSDCRAGSARRPQFSITVFFKPLAGAAQAAPGAAPAVPAAAQNAAPPAPAGGSGAPAPTSTPTGAGQP